MAALIIIKARSQDRCLRPALLLTSEPRRFSLRFPLGHFLKAVPPLGCSSAEFGKSSLLVCFGRFWLFGNGG
jgi:hypothetical protein